MKKLLDTKDVALFLGKSEWWVRCNREPLGIPARKVGNHWRYDPDEVLRWFQSLPAGDF